MTENADKKLVDLVVGCASDQGVELDPERVRTSIVQRLAESPIAPVFVEPKRFANVAEAASAMRPGEAAHGGSYPAEVRPAPDLAKEKKRVE